MTYNVLSGTLILYTTTTTVLYYCVIDLEIAVDDEATVHVLQTEYDFGAVEAHFSLREDSVLRQMIM